MKKPPPITNQPRRSNLPEEALDAMEELALVLKAIHLRMRREGYMIVDGKVVKKSEYEAQQKGGGSTSQGDC